jgi:hypothetical protein
VPNFKLDLTQNFMRNFWNTSVNDIYRLFVFALNQKGRSPSIFITEFHVGNYNLQQNELMTQSQSSSPIFLGLILTIILISVTIIFRRWTRSKKIKKEAEKEDKYNQESRCSLLKDTQDTFAVFFII